MSNNKKRFLEDGKSQQDIITDTSIEEELVFEDPYGDDYEDEEETNFENENNDNDKNDDNIKSNEDETIENQSKLQHSIKQVWRPGIDVLPEGEDLEYDPSAYIMYHSMQTEWPCLSFDFIRDNLGDARHRVSY